MVAADDGPVAARRHSRASGSSSRWTIPTIRTRTPRGRTNCTRRTTGSSSIFTTTSMPNASTRWSPRRVAAWKACAWCVAARRIACAKPGDDEAASQVGRVVEAAVGGPGDACMPRLQRGRGQVRIGDQAAQVIDELVHVGLIWTPPVWQSNRLGFGLARTVAVLYPACCRSPGCSGCWP